MNKIVSLALVAACLLSANALAVVVADCDQRPAPFREMADTYTYQMWSFANDDNPAAPTSYTNGAGEPSLEIRGNFVDNNVAYYDELDGAEGVWLITNNKDDQGNFGDMIITVPNYANDNPTKNIWIQMVYQAEGTPQLWALADGSDTPMNMDYLEDQEVVIDSMWTLGVWSVTLEPNPDLETIYIRPKNCTAYIDCVTVETECIPEPASLALLGLGGLLLRKRFA